MKFLSHTLFFPPPKTSFQTVFWSLMMQWWSLGLIPYFILSEVCLGVPKILYFWSLKNASDHVCQISSPVWLSMFINLLLFWELLNNIDKYPFMFFCQYFLFIIVSLVPSCSLFPFHSFLTVCFFSPFCILRNVFFFLCCF